MDRKSYQKYKYKVKIWETNFKKTYGRIPSKHDIHEADHEIREAYKMYFKLKSALLEETLMDIDLDDMDTSNPEESSQTQSQDDIDKPMNEFTCAIPDEQPNLQPSTNTSPVLEKYEFEKENTSWNVDKEDSKVSEIWGSHLSNKLKKESKPVAEKKEKNTTVKLSQKLFKNSSFSKRNPRKSLSSQSFNRSDLNLSQSCSQSESQNSVADSLPDFDQMLQSQALSQNSDISDHFNLRQNVTAKPLRSIDTGWLDRCNTFNNIDSKKYPDTDSGFSSLETSFGMKPDSQEQPSFGLGNIDLSALKSAPKFAEEKMFSKDVSDSDDVIYNSESEDDTIKHVLKRRKIEPPQTITSFNISPDSTNTNNMANKTYIPDIQINKEKNDIPLNKTSQIESSNKPFDNNILQQSADTTRPKLIYDVDKSEGTMVETQTKVKRPARSTKARKTVYAEVEDMDDKAEVDPYSFDNDLENDPDFKMDQPKNQDPENSDEVQPKKTRKRVMKKTDPTQKRVPRIPKSEKSKKTKTNNFHISLQSKRKTGSKKQIEIMDQPIQELKEPDYELEFAIDVNAENVSRYGVQVNTEIKGDLVKEFATAISTNAKDIIASNLTPAPGFEQIKLQKKANEKMNENFVRIDMKKKVYVRGKKPMNYSRYKKARWKERKAAALAGPDMDMRGCDGGLLKCFKCGHVGHFAEKCKAKIGDQLLPLEADVEVCPYPSLEEASAMASDSLLVAHASRPKSIPQASNLPIERFDKNDTISEIQPNSANSSSLVETSQRSGNTNDISVIEGIEPSSELSVLGKSSAVNNIANDGLDSTWKRHTIPEAFRNELLYKNTEDKTEMTSLYTPNPDGSLIKTPDEVYSILAMFGHKKFRPGQEKAIMRILSGLSTLVTLSTGSGKSLCYQLPAYLYAQTRPCITLVISPLVSLMEDQVTGVPDFLHATCLHTNQTPAQREKIMEAIQSGVVNILLVSPEAVVSGEKKTGFGALLRSLPPIAFACIDEAHCVSQWSHNFRPSYLMICQVLREKLGVKTVLGLTATATRQTRESIVRHLEVPDGLNGIISDIPLPNNLNLSVSKDPNRDRALIELLRSERFSNLQSIIVYCTRRQECERLAGLIRTCLQDNKPPEEKRKRKRTSVMWNAEPYHAGMAASRRRTIQKAFMNGDLRIVVATVAFGMGINKSDIRAIIHFNMPRTFENYVQEVGRAGRDGLEAHCHLFLDSKGEDQSELKRHIYADSIDRHVIRKLLQRVFIPCKCESNVSSQPTSSIDSTIPNSVTVNEQKDIESMQNLNWSDTSIDEKHGSFINSSFERPVNTRKRVCPGHEVAFSVQETVQVLDIPEENISTLLCYLELHQNNYVHVLSSAYTVCQITSYGGPKQLRLAAQNCPPLAMAIALDLKRGIKHDETSILEFKVVDIAAAIGWDSGVVKYQLKKLEWNTVDGASKRSTLNVEFSDLGFRVRSAGDLTDDELDETLDMLYERTSRQEKTALLQLQAVFNAMTLVAFDNCEQCSSIPLMEKRSNELKIIIRQYFQRENEQISNFAVEKKPSAESQIIQDVRAMVANYPENNFTGRALARIFYGIQSPNYPAVIWGRCRYWRAHLKEDFHELITIANREIIKMR